MFVRVGECEHGGFGESTLSLSAIGMRAAPLALALFFGGLAGGGERLVAGDSDVSVDTRVQLLDTLEACLGEVNGA